MIANLVLAPHPPSKTSYPTCSRGIIGKYLLIMPEVKLTGRLKDALSLLFKVLYLAYTICFDWEPSIIKCVFVKCI